MTAGMNLDGQICMFACHSENCRPKEWGAKLTCIQMSTPPYEAAITVDCFTYAFLIGHYINGIYISIPSMFKAADIASLYDIEHNEAKLRSAGLSKKMAVTFSKGLWIIDSMMDPRLPSSLPSAGDPASKETPDSL